MAVPAASWFLVLGKEAAEEVFKAFLYLYIGEMRTSQDSSNSSFLDVDWKEVYLSMAPKLDEVILQVACSVLNVTLYSGALKR